MRTATDGRPQPVEAVPASQGPAARGSRIVLLLTHALLLRNFETVVRELADRGNHVAVAFTAPRPDDAALVARLGPAVDVISPPKRAGWWWPTSESLRAWRDHLHYMQPSLAGSTAVRGRLARRLPAAVRRLTAAMDRLPGGRAALAAALDGILRAMPVDDALCAWLAGQRPDMVIATTLVDIDNIQADVLRAANAMGIATGDLVASWDNLTTKSRLHFVADRIFVWNDVQKGEAVSLHGVEADRVVTTGAQLYEPWFTMRPGMDRRTFCETVGGLDPDSPLVLYVGSSPFICPRETDFFREWLAALRAHPDERLRGAGVLVRPHPLHDEQWLPLKNDGDSNLAVWPLPARMPIGAGDKQAYFDSLWHADALVGINTSSFLEAAILGKRSFTPADTPFTATQRRTVHFSYVEDAGVILVSASREEHFSRLAQELDRQDRGRDEALERFVADFIRPGEGGASATANLAGAIEELGSIEPEAARRPWWGAALRLLLAPVAAAVIRPRAVARLAKRPEGGRSKAGASFR